MGEESFLVKCYNGDAETDLTTLYQFHNFESLSSLNESPEYEVSHHKFRKFSGQSNGIVCISDGYFNAFLINPALREIRPLPIIPSWRPVESREHGIGFGFDESTNDYKVVRMITMHQDSGLPQYVDIEIYTLSTNYWRKVGRVAGPPSIFHRLESPVFFKGLIHWPAQSCRRILTFNMATEVFEETLFPSVWKDYYEAQHFVMDDSNMALVAYISNVKHFVWLMDVWVMKEHGVSESWTRLYSVPPPSTYIEYIEPICLCQKDKLVMSTWELPVICYDFATEQHYQIRQFEDDGPWKFRGLTLFELVAFHESLISTYNV